MQHTLILTDIHITGGEERIIGLDPMERLQNVLATALRQHPDAERLVLMGDLTHHGTAEEYSKLKPVLAGVPIPITLTIGNHDIRATMADVLGADHLTDGFAQHAWQSEDTLFLLLDTVDEDGKAPQHGGWMCNARLDWVADQIAASDAQQIVCMMHHPPFMTGFPALDRIRLMNGDALYGILTQASVPVHLICGHVHRTISGSSHGLPFTVLKSTCHQMPMDLVHVNSGISVDEPGAYGLLMTSQDGIVVQTEDVFENPRFVSFDSTSE